MRIARRINLEELLSWGKICTVVLLSEVSTSRRITSNVRFSNSIEQDGTPAALEQKSLMQFVHRIILLAESLWSFPDKTKSVLAKTFESKEIERSMSSSVMERNTLTNWKKSTNGRMLDGKSVRWSSVKTVKAMWFMWSLVSFIISIFWVNSGPAREEGRWVVGY